MAAESQLAIPFSYSLRIKIMSQTKNKKLLKHIEKTDSEAIAEILSKKSAVFKKILKRADSKTKQNEKKINAVKRFQRFSEIPETGRINARTLQESKKPHCSFPNVSTRELNNLSLTPPRWNRRDITYGFINFTNQIPIQIVRQTIASAFAVWVTTVFPFNFRELSFDDGPMILISFVRNDHRDGYPFAGGDGDLAHAFPPNTNIPGLGGDIHFDNDERWAVSGAPGFYDLKTVAIHEIGHSLGLGHSINSTSIMFRTYQGVRHTIDNETRNLLRNLYQGV